MGTQPANSAGWRLKECRILSAAARRWLVNVFGKLIVEPRVISPASLRELFLFFRGTGLL